MKPVHETASVGDQLLTGTLWMGSWRWTARLLGFVSTLVTARFLLPEDFGIAAAALVVVAFFDILIDLGTDSYLVRLPDAGRADYDTAWTLRLIVVVAAAAAAFAAAGPVSALLGDGRLAAAVQLLAVASALRGFTNIGLTMYRRDMQFGRIAMIGLGARVCGFAVTVALAVLLQNYWAVVLGELAYRAAELVLSYVYHAYRPRLCLAHFRKQWQFCQWIVVRNIARFLQGRGDQLVVARFFGIEAIGFYAMAVRFAEAPTRHFMAPMLMPVYAALAKKQADADGFATAVVQVVAAVTAVVLPLAALFAVLDEHIVTAFLGANWRAAIPLLAPVVVTLLLGALGEPAVSVLTLRGQVRLLAALHWFSAVTTVAATLIAALYGHLETVVWVRAAVSGALLLLYWQFMRAALQIGWSRLLGAVYRPVLATAAAAVAIAVAAAMATGPWFAILIGTTTGGLVYAVLLYALWRCGGRADAGEALLAQRSQRLLARLAARLRN